MNTSLKDFLNKIPQDKPTYFYLAPNSENLVKFWIIGVSSEIYFWESVLKDPWAVDISILVPAVFNKTNAEANIKTVYNQFFESILGKQIRFEVIASDKRNLYSLLIFYSNKEEVLGVYTFQNYYIRYTFTKIADSFEDLIDIRNLTLKKINEDSYCIDSKHLLVDFDVIKEIDQIKKQENNFVKNSTPKEVVIHFSKLYLKELLSDHGFIFDEVNLKFTKTLPDFTQVINFVGDRNNRTGISANFGLGYSFYNSKFESWYKKRYKETPVGGKNLVVPNSEFENWTYFNPIYRNYWYEFIYDTEDQFQNLFVNLQNCVLPFFQRFNSLLKIIQNQTLLDKERINWFSYFRQMEHCLFIQNIETFEILEQNLYNFLENGNPQLKDYFMHELKRIKL